MHIAEILEQEPEIAKQAVQLRRNPDLAFPVLSAKIKLTWRCNLKCAMCNLWRRPHLIDPNTELYPEITMETLTDLKALGMRKIHFSGGEILLVRHFRQIIDHARSLDLQVNLTTNGTLVSKNIARYLIDARVHRVTVSIDSARKQEHDKIRGVKGAWDASWKGIERIQKRKTKKGRGPKIGINTVVTRSNIDKIHELYHLLIEHNVDSWRILPVDTEIKKIRPTAEQWEKLSENFSRWNHLLSRYPLDWSSKRSGKRAEGGKFAGVFYGDNTCFAPWFNAFIDADGKVYPCCMGKQNMIPYGNIQDNTIEQLMTGKSRREICCTMASGNLFPVCDQCDDFLEENQAINSLYQKYKG